MSVLKLSYFSAPKVKEPLESESFKVDKIILHPNFRYMLTQPDRYDIALLKLDHPVYYRYIC